MNETINSTILECKSVINNEKYKNIVCSISGGADSDNLLDLITKADENKKVKYLFIDTGIEYEATKIQIKKLEDKYGIKINTIRNQKNPIPTVVKKYGQPFLSKQASYYIYQLQRCNFEWEDTDDYIYLIKKYCKCYDSPHGNHYIKLKDGKYYKGCVGAILWWCNFCGITEWGLERKSQANYCISRNRGLKQFLIENPPNFKISHKCCDCTKKEFAHRIMKANDCDLSIMGLRKSEGGIRSLVYDCTFIEKKGTYDIFLPMFFWTNSDKEEYEKENAIEHSDCYTVYGFSRTGCVCCPFGKNFEEEIKQVEQYEPKLKTLCENVFGDSYEYTRKYLRYKKKDKGILLE